LGRRCVGWASGGDSEVHIWVVGDGEVVGRHGVGGGGVRDTQKVRRRGDPPTLPPYTHVPMSCYSSEGKSGGSEVTLAGRSAATAGSFWWAAVRPYGGGGGRRRGRRRRGWWAAATARWGGRLAAARSIFAKSPPCRLASRRISMRDLVESGTPIQNRPAGGCSSRGRRCTPDSCGALVGGYIRRKDLKVPINEINR
jgi:hypothetical protein